MVDLMMTIQRLIGIYLSVMGKTHSIFDAHVPLDKVLFWFFREIPRLSLEHS
jgi:hypothetical protein